MTMKPTRTPVEFYHELKKDIKKEPVKQTITLFTSQILLLLLGIITGMINARVLGPVGYGITAFFYSITTFILLFFHFGFFSTSALLIAEQKDKTLEKKLIGSSIIVTSLIGVSYSIFMLIFSFFVDSIFDTNVGWVLRYTSIILFVFPYKLLIPQMATGANEIRLLSVFNVLPKSLYIVFILLTLMIIPVEYYHVIVLQIFATLITVTAILYLFHPIFDDIKRSLSTIWKKNKVYGIHLYLGHITGQSTYMLDKIFITYFVNTIQLGFYSLALMITTPMVGLSQAISTSLFKSFTDMDKIPKKVIYYNFLWLTSCIVGLVLLGKVIVALLFTEEFLPVVPLIKPLALAGFFQGMYQPYHMFLVAKGKGKWKRNLAFILALVNLGGNIILVPLMGAMGAAIATLLAAFSGYLLNIFYYRKYDSLHRTGTSC